MPGSNRSLTIAVIIDPPTVMPCALDDHCPQRGIVYEIAQIMCKQLRFHCRFVPANTDIYGYFENGSWKGVVGDVAAGRVDTSLPRFTPTQQRAEAIDFSSSCFYEQYLLVTRRPSASIYKERLDLLHAFDPYVWTCIALVVLLAALVMRSTIMYKIPTSVIETYLIRPNNPEILFFGKYIIICTISAAALILARAYTGYLFTKRISTDVQKPFDDLESFAACVRTKRCTLALKTESLSYMHQLIDTDGSDSFGKLKKALDENPLQHFPLSELMTKILAEKSSFFTTLVWDTDFYYAANGTDLCQYYVISASLLPGSNTFPLPKNWPYRRELDTFARRFNEYGFIERMMDKYNVREKSQCKEFAVPEDDTLSFLQELFLFLMAGEIVAVLCFCIELRWRRRWLHEVVAGNQADGGRHSSDCEVES